MENYLSNELAAEPIEIGRDMSAKNLLLTAVNGVDAVGKFDQPDGTRSIEKTVEMFNTLTGHHLTASDGWLLMLLHGIAKDQARVCPDADGASPMLVFASLYSESRLTEQ